MTRARGRSADARLARAGFTDPGRAAAALESPLLAELIEDDAVLAALALTADPDAALDALQRLLTASPDPGELCSALRDDERLRAGLLAVLGASPALAQHLVRHPEHWRLLGGDELVRPSARGLRGGLLEAVGADASVPDPVAAGHGPAELDALRVAYRGALLGLAARDLSGSIDVADVAAELADLAAATLEAAVAIGRAEVGESAREYLPAVRHRDGQVRRARAQLRQRRRRGVRRRAGGRPRTAAPATRPPHCGSRAASPSR